MSRRINDLTTPILDKKIKNYKWWWEKIYKTSLRIITCAVATSLFMVLYFTLQQIYLDQRYGNYLYNCYAEQHKRYKECINGFPNNNIIYFCNYASLAIIGIGVWARKSLIPNYVTKKVSHSCSQIKANFVLDAVQNFISLFNKGQELVDNNHLPRSPFPPEITAKIIEYTTKADYHILFPEKSAARELLNKHLSGNNYTEKVRYTVNNDNSDQKLSLL